MSHVIANYFTPNFSVGNNFLVPMQSRRVAAAPHSLPSPPAPDDAKPPSRYPGGRDVQVLHDFENSPGFSDFVQGMRSSADRCIALALEKGLDAQVGEGSVLESVAAMIEGLDGKGLDGSTGATGNVLLQPSRPDFYTHAPLLLERLQTHLESEPFLHTPDQLLSAMQGLSNPCGPDGILPALITAVELLDSNGRPGIARLAAQTRSLPAAPKPTPTPTPTLYAGTPPAVAKVTQGIVQAIGAEAMRAGLGGANATQSAAPVIQDLKKALRDIRDRVAPDVSDKILLAKASDGKYAVLGTDPPPDLHLTHAVCREMVKAKLLPASPLSQFEVPGKNKGELLQIRQKNGCMWVREGSIQRPPLPADLQHWRAELQRERTKPEPAVDVVRNLTRAINGYFAGQEGAGQEAAEQWAGDHDAALPARRKDVSDLHERNEALPIDARFLPNPPRATPPKRSIRAWLMALIGRKPARRAVDEPIIYSEKDHGSLKAFATNHDFPRFQSQYNALIDGAIRFAEDHTQKAGAPAPAKPGESIDGIQLLQLKNNFEMFRGRLAPESTFYDKYKASVWGSSKESFTTVCAILRDESIPLHKRLSAVQNLANKCTACADGVAGELRSLVLELAHPTGGLRGEAERMKFRLAQQLVTEFMATQHVYKKGNEVHVVDGAMNFIGKDWGFAPQPAAMAEVPGLTGYTKDLLERCSAHVNTKLTPTLLVNAMAEEYHSLMREAVIDELMQCTLEQRKLWPVIPSESIDKANQRLRATAEGLAERYGHIPLDCVLSEDGKNFRFVTRPALIAASMSQILQEQGVMHSKPETVVSKPTVAGQPIALMHRNGALWIEADGQRQCIQMHHLKEFSASDILHARGGVAQVLAEALSGASARDVSNLSDDWFKRLSFAQLLPHLRGLSAEDCNALLARAVKLGLNIEQLDAKCRNAVFLCMKECSASTLKVLLKEIKDASQWTKLLCQPDAQGMTAFGAGMASGNAATVTKLIEAVLANPALSREQKLTLLHSRNANGQTALSEALVHDNIENMRAFVQAISMAPDASGLTTDDKFDLIQGADSKGVPASRRIFAWREEKRLPSIDKLISTAVGYVEEVLKLEALSEVRRTQLAEARIHGGSPLLFEALNSTSGDELMITGYMHAFLQSPLSNRGKVNLLKALDSSGISPTGLTGFQRAARNGVGEYATVYLDAVLGATQLEINEKLELADVKGALSQCGSVGFVEAAKAAIARNAEEKNIDQTVAIPLIAATQMAPAQRPRQNPPPRNGNWVFG